MPDRFIPNRVSIEATNPYFFPGCKDLGVRFDGVVRNNDVVEFDVKAGWIRIHIKDANGRPKAERGKFVAVKLRGVVEPYWRSSATY